MKIEYTDALQEIDILVLKTTKELNEAKENNNNLLARNLRYVLTGVMEARTVVALLITTGKI